MQSDSHSDSYSDSHRATYKDSGVDLKVYAESMSRLPKLAARTFSPQVLRLDGGFAGLFQLNSDAKKYVDPVLVSCTDGVGTKLKIACVMNRHTTVGIDLVAMSVNDAICCGARPLFFLDYVAMPKDDPDLLEKIVTGISNGCVAAGCSLIGGETAIMSDIYQPGEYDLAGFCVGVAEKKRILDGKAIRPGDVLIGVASSGLHSNGYSLVRKIVFEMNRLFTEVFVPELGRTVGEELLEPTRIYVKTVLNLLEKYEANEKITGIAHITGGGLEENLGRILPQALKAEIRQDSWKKPAVFDWLQKLGNVDPNEMKQVFNCGIGLVLVVRPEFADEIQRQIEFESWKIGVIRQCTSHDIVE